ncbi:hypothetical protein NW116_11305 [Staphylococcus pettenkoferi]|mgnify:CR=1 FL=1|nr:hypothetical protein [Staphylococcus pettenkoferi]MCY1600508.1 hypothetical protein [Staphylococcus pettenkoferi]
MAGLIIRVKYLDCLSFLDIASKDTKACKNDVNPAIKATIKSD